MSALPDAYAVDPGSALRFRLDGHRLIPPHLHSREDEVTFVLRGPVGVQVGDEEFEAGSGSFVLAPKNLFHAYWSPGDGRVELVGFIAPGGFEHFFEDFQPAFNPAGAAAVDPSAVAARRAALAQRYGLVHSRERLDALRERHGLRAMGE